MSNVSIALTDLQKQVVGVSEVTGPLPGDPAGKPCPIKGVPTFTVSPAGLISIFPAVDGTSVEIDALTGQAGTSTITVTATDALGNTISRTITVVTTIDTRDSAIGDIVFNTSAAPSDHA